MIKNIQLYFVTIMLNQKTLCITFFEQRFGLTMNDIYDSNLTLIYFNELTK